MLLLELALGLEDAPAPNGLDALLVEDERLDERALHACAERAVVDGPLGHDAVAAAGLGEERAALVEAEVVLAPEYAADLAHDLGGALGCFPVAVRRLGWEAAREIDRCFGRVEDGEDLADGYWAC